MYVLLVYDTILILNFMICKIQGELVIMHNEYNTSFMTPFSHWGAKLVKSALQFLPEGQPLLCGIFFIRASTLIKERSPILHNATY